MKERKQGKLKSPHSPGPAPFPIIFLNFNWKESKIKSPELTCTRRHAPPTSVRDCSDNSCQTAMGTVSFNKPPIQQATKPPIQQATKPPIQQATKPPSQQAPVCVLAAPLISDGDCSTHSSFPGFGSGQYKYTHPPGTPPIRERPVSGALITGGVLTGIHLSGMNGRRRKGELT